MKIFDHSVSFQNYCRKLKNRGRIGFVPTMGCLHEGHLSLINSSVKTCDFTVVSIFVNPLQFGKNEDFSIYPRPLKNDLFLCRKAGADAVFLPDVKKFYKHDFSIKVEENKLSKNFCGALRPGHFSGVVTVVAKLLNCALPDVLFLGQKDYQQCLVLKRLVRDLNFPVAVKICPTKREKSGLALSSRNKYLTSDQKVTAAEIYKSLFNTKKFFQSLKNQGTNDCINKTKLFLKSSLKKIHDFSVQYADLASADTLDPVTPKTIRIIALVAGYLGNTRLIDNLRF
jgi:pantoate--beta-alanine ligase